jgi:alkanesulfonate monooxygenase
MSVEFIGMIGTRDASETRPPSGPVIDRDYIARFAQAHENGGFDRVLVGYFSNAADGFLVTAHAAHATTRLGFLLAHRPGFVAPTVAARKLATLDQFTGGRAAVHIISGGDDQDQQRDGDYLGHDERYARTDEYVDILRQVWTSDRPTDYDGTYYRFRGTYSEVKPVQKPHLPIYFGGSSDAAVAVAGRHADVYALWGESREQVRDTIREVRAAAARHGRSLRFSVSFRPILAATEAAAWDRAEGILARVKQLRAKAGLGAPPVPQNVGSQRLLAAAARGDVLDKRLWTAVAAATGARGNTTALVGTPEEVAGALLEYYDLGVTTFLIRGFDPLDDAVDYGRALLPLVRAEVARREAAAVPGRVVNG